MTDSLRTVRDARMALDFFMTTVEIQKYSMPFFLALETAIDELEMRIVTPSSHTPNKGGE